MSSYKTNYLKSCFITLIFTLVYILIFKLLHTELEANPTTLLTLGSCFVVLVGLVSPLSFFLTGKYITKVKEPARPEELVESNQKKINLSKKALNSINANPQTNARKEYLKRKEKELNKSTNSNSEKVTTKNKNELLDKSLATDNIKESTSTSHDFSNNNSEPFITIYVSNLPYKTNDTELRRLFSQFGGKLYSINLTRDKVTKRKKGIAFIKISRNEGLKAIEKLNGTIISGRNIMVKIANDHGKQPDLDSSNS